MSRLIDELKKLPGVGAKSAQRLAFHILRSSDEDAEALAVAVRDVKANLRLCSVCNNITDVDPCAYCTSATRNQRLVCVVEEATNIAAIWLRVKVEANRPKPVEKRMKINAASARVAKLPLTGTPNTVTAMLSTMPRRCGKRAT